MLLLATGLLAQEPRPGPEVVVERQPFFGRYDVLVMRRARLGVQVSPVAEQTDSIGALIQSVTPNGPADKAGIKSGDVITRINGQSLVEGNLKVGRGQSAPGLALSMIAGRLNAGDSVLIQFQRGKDRKVTTLIAGDEPVFPFTFTERLPFDPGDDMRVFPESLGPEVKIRRSPYGEGPPRGPFEMRPRVYLFASPLADLVLAPVNPELGRYFGAGDGVLVINIPEDSKLNLKPGDVVLSVDGRKVKVPSQLFRVLQSYEPGEEFKLEIMRMKKRETVTGSVTDR
jgi:S1-C subfamily serine protease